MTVQTVETVIVQDYAVKELVFGQDYLVVISGELAGQRFAIAGNAPISGSQVVVEFVQERSWRTLWRRKRSIAAKGDLTPACALYLR